MRKILSTIIATVAVLLGAINTLATIPAFAADENCVDTAILGGGTVCDNGSGDSVLGVLKIVVDVLTVGVGIFGVIGIVIVGIQYMTAGDSEEQVRKSKRRLFEIIIGLAVYVLIYALLSWLLPGTPFNWSNAVQL